ncbi:MAG: hypothetical protein ABI590_05570, partial [Ilumatobacteraceae bacterium]
ARGETHYEHFMSIPSTDVVGSKLRSDPSRPRSDVIAHMQIARLHLRNASMTSSDLAQVVLVGIGVVAIVTEHLMVAGLIDLSATVSLQLP